MSDIDIQHLANLARIEISKDEQKLIEPQIESIIAYVGKLSEVDTSNVPQSVYMTDAVNVIREDVVEDCDPETRKRLIEAFPEKMGDALQVQGVFENRTE